MFKPNLIEDLIATHLDSPKAKYSFDKEYLQIVHILKNKEDEYFEKALEDLDLMPTKIISLRIKKCHTYSITNKVLFALSYYSTKPSVAVMYVWYLQYWSFKNACTLINENILLNKIFPIGFFSEETMQSFWIAQKLDKIPQGSFIDNALDYYDCGKSIFPE